MFFTDTRIKGNSICLGLLFDVCEMIFTAIVYFVTIPNIPFDFSKRFWGIFHWNLIHLYNFFFSSLCNFILCQLNEKRRNFLTKLSYFSRFFQCCDPMRWLQCKDCAHFFFWNCGVGSFFRIGKIVIFLVVTFTYLSVNWKYVKATNAVVHLQKTKQKKNQNRINYMVGANEDKQQKINAVNQIEKKF